MDTNEALKKVRERKEELKKELNPLKERVREIERELWGLDGQENNLCGGGWGS